MREKRDSRDDDVDRETVLAYVRAHPGKSCQEAEIKKATGIAKSRVRWLMSGMPEIDQAKLAGGAVCWNPPSNQSSQ